MRRFQPQETAIDQLQIATYTRANAFALAAKKLFNLSLSDRLLYGFTPSPQGSLNLRLTQKRRERLAHRRERQASVLSPSLTLRGNLRRRGVRLQHRYKQYVCSASRLVRYETYVHPRMPAYSHGASYY
jgi:hypothetical protein